MSTSSSNLGHDAAASPRRVIVLLLRELGPILLGTLCVFGTLEFVLRSFDDFGRVGPGRIGYEWIGENAYVNRGKPWFEYEFTNTIVLNEEGFHAPSFALDPDRPTRIALFGDSYVKSIQVSLAENFVQQAQDQLPGIHVLAMGTDGSYAPLQKQAFVEDLPRLFGEDGKYPGVDGVVFCIRLWGGMNIAQGVRDYPVTMPEPRWTYPAKAPVVTFLNKALARAIASPLHSVSLASSKASDWLRADLRNQQNPVDMDGVENAARVLHDEVFVPIRDLAAERGLPIAFLYLPSIAEFEGTAGPVETRMRELTHAALEAAGLQWMDATPYFHADSGQLQAFFFASDRHPNAAGHARMGEALADLVRAMTLAP